MPTIQATRYTNFDKKFKKQQSSPRKNGNGDNKLNPTHQKPVWYFEKNENLEEFKLPLIKHALPATKRRISERKEYSVNPFPKRGSGHGTYQYDNKYFKYEGEWRNGVKHGQGKLMMTDGSYYEGTFTNGEIDGKGFRYFSHTGSKYTGHFSKGELHGRGTMVYIDGSIYDGEWYRNRKHGYGVMKTLGPEVYEGGYNGNLKHGVGIMLYAYKIRSDGCRNGDRYEGMWVNDIRQGHGILYFNDGSVYDGEFNNDYFNGKGIMHHISGIVYNGLWVNGYPENMATKLVIVAEEQKDNGKKKVKDKKAADSQKRTIYQGIGFTIRVECRNECDRVIEDQGREIRISAGFKYYPPPSEKEKEDALFDMIEDDLEETPIPTPFGYSIVPYPLTDQINANLDDIPDDEEALMDDQTKTQTDTNPENPANESGEDENTEENKENTEENSEEKIDEEKENEDNEEVKETQTEIEKENAVPQLPPVDNAKSVNGVCEWNDLHLTPAPPKYRPFERKEAEERAKNPSRTKSRSKENSGLGSSLSRHPSVLEKFRKNKQKALEEKFAKLGEYVLMVEDVTSPPFMDKTLEPAFLLLKLKQPPKEMAKSNKPKWDTKSHIESQMRSKEEV